MSPQSQGFRLYLLPQRSFVRTDPYEIGPAFPELSGHIIVKRQGEYDAMEEAQVVTLLKRVALLPGPFEAAKEHCVLN
jgi:hypothetical protein